MTIQRTGENIAPGVFLAAKPEWHPPPQAALDTAFQRLVSEHPKSVYLTLVMKLQTSRWKEALLTITQLRYTNMKAAVLTQFQHDLAQLAQGQSDTTFISAVIDSIQAFSGQEGVDLLAQALSQLKERFSGIMLVRAIMIALTEPATEFSAALHALQTTLNNWQQSHPDRQIEKTLEGLRKARTGVKKDVNGYVVDEGQPKFTEAQIVRIQMYILLRKMLAERVTANLQVSKMLALATDIAQESDHQRRQAMHAMLTRRSEEQAIQRCISVLCERFADATTLTHAEALHQYLQQLLAGEKKDLRKNANQHGKRVPLLWLVIDQLAATDRLEVIEIIGILREQLQPFLPSTKDLNAIENADQLTTQHYIAALTKWLEPNTQASTNVLVLVELAEAAERGLNDGVMNLYNTLSRCYSDFCSTFDYPLSSSLRAGVFQDCARSLISWAAVLVEYRVDQLKRQELFSIPLTTGIEKPRVYHHNPYRYRQVILLPSLYTYWRAEENEYNVSAQTEMPLGPDVGKTFGNPDRTRRRKQLPVNRRKTTTLNERYVGKRGVRRLQRWLIAENLISTTLEHIEVLLYPRQKLKERVELAKQAPHPTWTNKKRKRRIMAMRSSQHQEPKHGTRVALGSVSREQLIVLRNQLYEQVRYRTQLEVIKRKMARFLEDAPPAYPRIEPMRVNPERLRSLPDEAVASIKADYDHRSQQYRRALNRFYDFRPTRGNPLENYTDEHLFDIYSLAAQELEQAAAQLAETKGQPVSYFRTMNSQYDPKAFTLLMYQRTTAWHNQPRYILACEFSGEEAPERLLLKLRSEHAAREGRTFVNWPSKDYDAKQSSKSMMYFAMELGAKHQGRKLRDVVLSQQELERADEGRTPEAAIGTATIVEGCDHKGYNAWFAHIPVPVYTTAITQQPNAAIGFHEYKGQYYFAIIDLQGSIINLGEIDLPSYLTTKRGMQSGNYAFGVAQAILNLSSSTGYITFIGIEDTSWKTATPSLAPKENQATFAHPRQRIVEITTYKAAIRGFLAPTQVRRVAPSRDCGQCGHRSENTAVQHFATTACFLCTALGREHSLRTMVIEEVTKLCCSTCNRQWASKERQFKCTKCGKRQHARYNTALVVVHKLLQELTNQNTGTE